METLKLIYGWLVAHWGAILLALVLLCSFLNAATRVWTESKGLAKVALFLTDCLSIIRSRGQTGEVLGNAKLPLVPTGLGKGDASRALLPFLLAVGLASSLTLGASGCATTPRGYISKALVAVGAADPAAILAIQKACEPKVKVCPPGPAESCPAFVSCAKALTTYQATATAITRELETLNKLLFDLEVK